MRADGAGAAPPLTVGTAGHVDHGKTVLVRALTGVDTDRLEEERRRGISIELGYAPLPLPSGRQLSLIDVPGHARFIRTMVAGATGVDLFLMVVAADDGVMPQTREHAAVLRALGVGAGVVAITKSDIGDVDRAGAEVAELLPDVPIVPVCAPTGAGLGALREALDERAAGLPGRARPDRPARLHVDRVFTVHGAGTVVTGTLWEGCVERGDELILLPGERAVRVRGVQVHDEAVSRAAAGQRVALNLAGVARTEVARGDALVGAGGPVAAAVVLQAAIERFGSAHKLRRGERVQVHHGTRETAARVQLRPDGAWRLHLERPLFAVPADRFVVRSIAPPDTIGGGVISETWTAEDVREGERPAPVAPPPAPVLPEAPARPGLSPRALEFEAVLRADGVTALSAHGDAAETERALGELAAAGKAVRVSRDLYYDPELLEDVRRTVVTWLERRETITLPELRDALATSRKHAQALLEHFDRSRLTLRLPDDRRILRGRRPAADPAGSGSEGAP